MAEIENLKIGNGTIHIVGNQDIVADSWEAGKTYVADRSYVIREHILYVCNTTHTSVEPFDPTKWTATTIGEALGMAGSANVIECTLAEYTAWKAGGLLINETTYILTDAPNLNATSEDLSYDGGATSTHDVVESLKTSKFDASKIYARNNNGTIASGAVGSLSYPTGFDNTALLFISCKYASGKLFFALPQLGASTYNIYFRDGSGTLPSGDYSWYELWVKPNT